MGPLRLMMSFVGTTRVVFGVGEGAIVGVVSGVGVAMGFCTTGCVGAGVAAVGGGGAGCFFSHAVPNIEKRAARLGIRILCGLLFFFISLVFVDFSVGNRF